MRMNKVPSGDPVPLVKLVEMGVILFPCRCEFCKGDVFDERAEMLVERPGTGLGTCLAVGEPDVLDDINQCQTRGITRDVV
jgi:hypothetical protein